MNFNSAFDDVNNEAGMKETYRDSKEQDTPSISYHDPEDNKTDDPDFLEQLIDDLFLDDDNKRSE
ncbi:hypothetical protein [Macrococcus lamae]|uniref:Uncharacterized protein n=1 Tax=Macrococcus lamae TaxID=198484 RepID=A0A4R6BUG9_9STAP|nr:hypothetical protein [Macrococcus lamae]TDM11943.1 hypothetical protein ERX29_04950 [Macrococcus lamae]